MANKPKTSSLERVDRLLELGLGPKPLPQKIDEQTKALFSIAKPSIKRRFVVQLACRWASTAALLSFILFGAETIRQLALTEGFWEALTALQLTGWSATTLHVVYELAPAPTLIGLLLTGFLQRILREVAFRQQALSTQGQSM